MKGGHAEIVKLASQTGDTRVLRLWGCMHRSTLLSCLQMTQLFLCLLPHFLVESFLTWHKNARGELLGQRKTMSPRWSIRIGEKGMPFSLFYSLPELEEANEFPEPSSSPSPMCHSFCPPLSTFLKHFSGGSAVKIVPVIQKMWILSLGWDNPLEKEMKAHSSIFAWEIQRKRLGELQSMGLQKSWTWLSTT